MPINHESCINTTFSQSLHSHFHHISSCVFISRCWRDLKNTTASTPPGCLSFWGATEVKNSMRPYFEHLPDNMNIIPVSTVCCTRCARGARGFKNSAWGHAMLSAFVRSVSMNKMRRCRSCSYWGEQVRYQNLLHWFLYLSKKTSDVIDPY